ncbi:helix-turn-helix domain-containing protein [Nocardiopsis synnemataformans]|uniref:helix-turn-helix domain-containing protein n=1 Tax=Nocardiopsis synnemataformans TaxID=61305 RepID=UPI003EBC229A
MSSTESFSPTVRRRRLSAELIALREKAQLTLEQAAAKLEWSRAKIANIETGKRKRPYVTDVELLLNIYGVTDEAHIEAFRDLTRQARTQGWWTKYGDLLDAYTGFEAEASSISTYQPNVIPGLLQTPDYAAASARAAINSSDDVERIVDARMRRQQILKTARPPRLWSVIDEAVIARGAGTKVMREQIQHLVEMAERHTNITVQLLPFSAGLHAGASGPFVILDFPVAADPSLVYLETRHDGLYLEEPEVIADYRTVLGHVQGAALSPAESVTHLTSLIEE